MKSRFFIVVLLCVIFLPGLALAGEHQRDSWYIGFGLGGGIDASWEVDGQDVTLDDWLESRGYDADPKIAINFKVGATLTSRSLLGFDITAVGQTGDAYFGDGHAQINNYFLMYTYFPMEEGFFIRAGGGFSSVHIDHAGYTDTVGGFGFLGGIGYAFWIGDSFNLTLNVDYSRQFYSGGVGDPDNSQFAIAYLGFDWY